MHLEGAEHSQDICFGSGGREAGNSVVSVESESQLSNQQASQTWPCEAGEEAQVLYS